MDIESLSPVELYAIVGGRAEALPQGHELRLRYESFLRDMPTYTHEEGSRENVFGPKARKIASNVAARQYAYIEVSKDALKEILTQMTAAD